VAETPEEAERRALPQLVQMAGMRSGRPLRPQLTIEQAEADDLVGSPIVEAMRAKWVLADPDTAAERVRTLASTYDVDEVMIQPVAGAYDDTPTDRTPTREDSLRLLAGALG
jgi:alkanesulfonate monooxygenase SsuD/methylene tetrahydromethanopterin reductase-like flavin-dependent oxidoreductase (luciferase family)